MNRRFWWFSSFLLLAAAGAARAGSLWPESETQSMSADKKAHAVGDILTIVVQESSTASKDNSTQTAKKSSLDASIATFLYSPAASGLLTHGGQLPAMKTSSQHDFSGGGSINNAEKIVAKIPVRVVDVLPNHNLVIEGSRETAFANEHQQVVLRGVVRREDIAANNTVFSYNVADATIKFINKGAVSDTQNKGWFTRLWDKVTPF
jgi:flagellar L-ring protein precursor FlgH